jgi:phage-related protein
MELASPKEVVWVGSSLEDLKSFPDSVKLTMGFALFQAQCHERTHGEQWQRL